MTSTGETRSARSWLFAPGDSERKMEKAAAGTADIVILDLEDAVTEDGKPGSRAMVSAFLSDQPKEDRSRLWVRVNPLDGPHTLADLAAVIPARPGGIMLPKSRGRADTELLDRPMRTETTASASAAIMCGPPSRRRAS
jgi:citrate lyase subunit beta/citryl-CoA lyase